MSRSRWLAAALLLSLPARAVLAQAPLGWRWQDKDSFYVEWKTHIDTVRQPPREPGKAPEDPKALLRMSEDLRAVYRVTVLNRHPDGGVDLEVRVESVTTKIVPGRTDPGLLEGHTLRVSLNAALNVVRLEGLEPALRRRYGDGALPPQARLFRAELEDACRSWLEDVFIPLANRPVRAGEKWEQQTERALMPVGRHVLRKTFTEGGTVAGSGRALTRVTVAGESALVPYPDGEFNLPYRVTRGRFKSASYSGTYFFDPAAGRLVQGETRLKMQLHALLTAEGRDIELETNQEHVTAVRVLDRRPPAESPALPRFTAIPEELPPGADAPFKHLLKGEDSRRVAQLEKRIGELTDAGLWTEALKLARQVHELRVRVQGARHWQAADAARNVQTLERLATLTEAERAEFLATPRLFQEAARLTAAGKAAEAQALYDKAWEVRGRLLGVDHHSTVLLYADVASALARQGNRAEAQALAEKSLDLCRRVLGEEHPDTARAYANLGGLLVLQGRAAEADPLLRRALTVWLRVLGEDAVATAQAFDQLGTNLNGQNRFAEARTYLERGLAIAQRLVGADDPVTMQCANMLSMNLMRLNLPAEAEPLLRRCLEYRLRKGQDDQLTALNYSNLATCLMWQHRLAEAEPLLRRALEVYRRALGEGHMDTIRAYRSLGQLLRSVGKEREGDEMMRRGEELFRRAPGG